MARETLVSIQYLRGLAALMVVAHHARNPVPWLYNPLVDFNTGGAGVDIFFVISGFIMYVSARSETPRQFAWRRFVRIVPLYWIATFVTLGRQLRQDPAFSVDRLQELVLSLLFVPHYNRLEPTQIFPLLVPGWTLNFEMFFYAVFAFGLFTRRLTLTIAVLLIGLVVAGQAHASEDPIWKTYTDPMLLEFFAGLILARYRDRLAHRWAIALLPIGLIMLAASSTIEAPRLLEWGLPSLAIVAGALAIERTGKLPISRLGELVGNASYSIYLFQFFGIAVATRIAQRMPFGPWQLATMLAASMIAATVIGIAAYYVIERPVTRLLKRRVPKTAAKRTAIQA